MSRETPISAKSARAGLFRRLGKLRRVGCDARAVHDFRKAAARLRSVCELAGNDTLVEALRRLRRTSARPRDVDVVLELAPPAPLVRWLRKERRRRSATFARTLRRAKTEALRRQLARLPGVAREAAKDVIQHTRSDVEDRGAELGADSSTADFHRVRRALRRLRLQREWTGRGTKRIENVLDALGELNDLATARNLARRCPARKVLREWRHELDARIDEASQRALAAWHAYIG